MDAILLQNLNSLFDSYSAWFGNIPQRNTGLIIADRPGRVTQYASLAMADRGELFVDVGVEVYKGMILIYYLMRNRVLI